MRLPLFLLRQRKRSRTNPKPRLFLLRRVNGDSMAPTLVHGDLVVGVWPGRVKPGHMVVVRHDNLEKIKRVQAVRADGVFLVGDNAAHSTDSRDFGWLPLGAVTARVVWK